ncbi:DUF308 domain-containing protein [Candidatus Saccharibacteria bacterium]|nr:DUF308 domain-containing protein [Candidatus Saccharibacteria bacterium]MBR3122044.1 DUF308 domain-containing protein [Candidatus Saccharibacteria bacterium]
MAKINRKFIDRHWLMFVVRGAVAAIFGCLALFGGMANINSVIAVLSLFLLAMGIVDTVGALYASTKSHGWINSIIDALVDIIAALMLLFYAKDNLVSSLVIISIYTIASGAIDVFHGFISTVDPTDRFIRVLAGVCGCIIGVVILNTGDYEITTFIRFFGAYMLIVGVTSMIYGVHNRAQKIEDKTARSAAAKKPTTKKATSKKHTRK